MAKKDKPTPEYDSKREQNVLLEEIRRDVKTVAEGHAALDHKLDKVNNKLEEHDRCFNMLETAVTEIGTKVKEMDTRLKSVEQKLDTVTEDHEKRITKLELIKS